jgi:Fur family ferric uptake transcriptional regulator
MDEAEKILRELGLHITVARLTVLNIFLRTSTIIDHSELMARCEKSINRITLYRTLQAFYEHHLLAKVPSSNGIAKYIYRGTPAHGLVPRRKTPERHVHLICQDCGKIISLEHFSLPRIDLPKDFKPNFIDLIVNGKCASCAENTASGH